jgi:hypothetical protein
MENTMKATATQIKTLLEKQALTEGPDLNDPQNRFTIWSENGPFGGFYCEGHAEFDYQTAAKLGECLALKNHSRTAVLDALEDRLFLYSIEVGYG